MHDGVPEVAAPPHPELPDGRRKGLAPVGAIGGQRVAVQLLLRCEVDQAFPLQEPDHQADDEGAAAEPERVDAVAFAMVQAQEFVECENPRLDAQAERQPDHRERPEGRGADAVAEGGDLLAARQVERLIESPHIGLERLGSAVAGAIGEDDDIPAHLKLRRRLPLLGRRF